MLRLYKEAGWWKSGYSDNAAFFTAMVRGSFCFVGAFINRRMVGMGRCLSDGVSDAYIHDVTVLPRFRGKGVGGRIVTALVKHLRARGIEWIGLIAEPEAQPLYKELGFTPIRSFTPMMWAGDE